MARPSKTALVDFDAAHTLTHGLLERAQCPPGKAFVLLRDAENRGLRLRITMAGGKHWQYEARISGKLFTRSLGPWPGVAISEAQTRAIELRGLAAQKKDPRELEQQARERAEAERAQKESATAEALAKQEARRADEAVRAITVGEVWARYLVEGRPKRRDAWKPGYRASMEAMATAGGEPKKRGRGLTRPGPLFPLLALPLAQVNEDTLTEWFDREAVTSRHQAARALMIFRGLLRWCAARPEYRSLTDRSAGKAPAIMENLPSTKRRTDALEAAQLRGWWEGIEQLHNRTAGIYLRALLLTGARREELASLTWANVDFQWRKLTIADKVDATRTIPMSPYLALLLATLPRAGQYVFASTGRAGRIADARSSHAQALRHAGIEHLTFHGLRRSFSLLGEAAGAPAGAIAQIMGHKPSATAEGYRPRSIDALRPFLEKIEAHILERAGVQFDAQTEPARLRVVAG